MGKRKWVWILGGTVAFCAALVLLVVFVTGYGGYDLPTRARDLDKAIADCKALGLPMTQVELKGEIPRDSENAAPGVIAAAMRLGNPSYNAEFFKVTDDVAVRTEQNAWFQSHGAQLDEIVQTLEERKKWFVDRDYDMSIALLFPELSQYRFAGKMLALRGSLRAKGGDVAGALGDLLAARALSSRIETEPFLIAMLVSAALDLIALRSLESYVDSWRNDPRKLRQLEDAVKASNRRLDPTQALRGEFYFELSICRNLRKFGGMRAISGDEEYKPPPMPSPERLQRTGLPSGMLERASLAVMAELWAKAFLNLRNSPDKRGWSVPFDLFQVRTEQRFRASEVLAQILVPVFSQADESLRRSDVNQQLAPLFVGAFRYRSEHGRWPKSVAEIAADAVDPYSASGDTFRCKFSDTEVRVWSVGHNGVDEGGKLRDAQHKERDDIVFVWPPSLRKSGTTN